MGASSLFEGGSYFYMFTEAPGGRDEDLGIDRPGDSTGRGWCIVTLWIHPDSSKFARSSYATSLHPDHIFEYGELCSDGHQGLPHRDGSIAAQLNLRQVGESLILFYDLESGSIGQ